LDEFFNFLQRKIPLELSLVAEFDIAGLLISIAHECDDHLLICSALNCLSIWPFALSDMTVLILNQGYTQLLNNLLNSTERSYDVYILKGITNLVTFHPEFRPVFYHNFQPGVIFQACLPYTPSLDLEIASCFRAIVEFLPINSEVAEFAAKAFGLILFHRLISPCKSEAHLHTLYGILIVLRSREVSSEFLQEIAISCQIPVMITQFFHFQSNSKEVVYATLITAQMSVLRVPNIDLCFEKMLDIFMKESMKPWYYSIISGLVQIIQASPSGLLDDFIRARFLPMLTDLIPVADYRSRSKIIECIFLILDRIDIVSVAGVLDESFFHLMIGFLDGEDDEDFVNEIVVGIHSIMNAAMCTGLTTVLDHITDAFTDDSREVLIGMCADEARLPAAVLAARDIVEYMEECTNAL
jgi:hypothetical protein